MSCRGGCIGLLLFVVSCQGLGGVGRSISLHSNLQSALDTLIAPIDAHAHIGVQIVSSRTGAVLYEHNASQHFTPASVLKVITGAAALYWLGSTYRFSTELYADEIDRSGKVLKNLVLRGSGDPSLTDNDLNNMAYALKQQGITGVTGDIVLDDTAFDGVPWGKGWMWDDLTEGFNAPVSGINILHNAIAVTLVPASRLGEPARIFVLPPSSVIGVQNNVITGVPKGVPTIRTQGTAADSTGLVVGQTIVINGTLPSDAGPWSRDFAVHDGVLWAGALLREHLHNLHIEVGGNVRRGVTPSNAALLTVHASRALSHALIDFMKTSNNHGMECLLKRMGAQTSMAPGSWQNGVAAVKNFLTQHVGLDAATLKVVDGSGDSRYSLVTPAQMVAVLRHMHHNFALGPEFMAALPVGGLDGTLANRFEVPQLHSRVRAKTGTMTGVSNLVGYLATDDDVLIFSIMSENFTGSPEPMRRLQEQLLLTVANMRPS